MKKQVIGIAGGLGIILLASLTTDLINFWHDGYLARTLSVKELNQEILHPSFLFISISVAEKIIVYLSYIGAGFFAAQQVKRNGWLNGAILGIILTIISYAMLLSITLYVLTIPNDKLSISAQAGTEIKQIQISSLTNSIPQKVLGIIFTISLTTLGGILSDRRQKPKIT